MKVLKNVSELTKEQIENALVERKIPLDNLSDAQKIGMVELLYPQGVKVEVEYTVNIDKITSIVNVKKNRNYICPGFTEKVVGKSIYKTLQINNAFGRCNIVCENELDALKYYYMYERLVLLPEMEMFIKSDGWNKVSESFKVTHKEYVGLEKGYLVIKHREFTNKYYIKHVVNEVLEEIALKQGIHYETIMKCYKGN